MAEIDKWKHIFGLGFQLAKVNFKSRNEGTWLGILWYLLAPLLMYGLLWGVFNNRVGPGISNYPLYLFLGILLFNYFARISSDTVRIFRDNSGLIRSINFPLESLIIGAIITVLFSHVFEFFVLAGFLLLFDVPISMIIFYPFILLWFSIFIFGFVLVLSSLGTLCFDLNNIWNFFITILWFMTPIFYAIEGQKKLFYLNLFNPVYYFLAIAREVIIYGRVPEIWMLLIAIFYSLIFLLVGMLTFYKFKKKFAELI